MLSDLQTWLEPYLGVFGVNVWLQAAVAIIGSLVLAWIFDHFICALLKKLTSRTQFEFDDYIIDHIHKPIHATLILIGLALAVDLLKLDEFFDEVLLSLLLSIGYIVWTIFLIRTTRALPDHGEPANLTAISKHRPDRHPGVVGLCHLHCLERRYDGLAGVGGHHRYRRRFCRQGHPRQSVFGRLYHGGCAIQDR
jgi:hypothetical protein